MHKGSSKHLFQRGHSSMALGGKTMVVWLLGISGSGKTTLSKKLKAYYGALGRKVYLLNGDVVRNFYDKDLGYTKEDINWKA